MFEINKPTEAVLNGDIQTAMDYLSNGDSFSGSYFENNKTQVFSTIVRLKASVLVDELIKSGDVQTDIYELDSFERSFFKVLAYETKNEESSIAFLKSFLEKAENLNDEINDQTLLGYFLNSAAEPEAIKCLIEAGCDALYKDNTEKTLIHHVVNNQMLHTQKGLAYLQILLNEGVDADTKDIVGKTALLIAVSKRKNEYAELLLQNGAASNEQDKEGISAFFAAVVWQQDKELYDLLRQYGLPNFDLTANLGDSLLIGFIKGMSPSSLSHKELLQQLLADGASIYQTSLDYGIPKSGVDYISEKPAELLKIVLETGAIDINRQDDQGNTILHKVCAFDILFDGEKAKETYKKVKLLLESGADATITNDKNEAPSMLAQQDSLKIKTVELLMRN